MPRKQKLTGNSITPSLTKSRSPRLLEHRCAFAEPKMTMRGCDIQQVKHYSRVEGWG